MRPLGGEPTWFLQTIPTLRDLQVKVGGKTANSHFWTIFKIWSLGVAIVMGGNYCVWNQGLQAGMLGFCVNTILAGTSFGCLLLCISEIISGLPFSGGAFGMVRCSIGLFPGYIIGCSEFCYYILTFCQCLYPMPSLIMSGQTLSAWSQACMCLALHLFICVLMIQKNTLAMFWNATVTLGLSAVITTFVYCFGSLGTPLSPDLNWNNSPVRNDAFQTISTFSTVTWFYLGIEGLAFFSKMVPAPRQLIAKGFFAALCTAFVSNIFVVCVTLYIYQDMEQLILEAFPLVKGFKRIFKCTDLEASLLSIPSYLGAAFGCAFGYSKLLWSLAESGLFPSFLTKCSKAGCPYKSILCGALLSYCICLILQFSPFVSLAQNLGNLCFLSAYVSYCGYCVSYVILKSHYAGSIDFSFKSPVGIGGATYVICVFVYGIISVPMSDGGISFYFLIVFWIFSSFYYYTVAIHRQKFSTDEQKSIFLSRGVAFVSKMKRKVDEKTRKLPVRIYVAPVPAGSQVNNRAKEVDFMELTQNPKYQTVNAVHKMLLDPKGAENLREVASAAFCSENVDFCLAVITYRMHIEGILKLGMLYEHLEEIIPWFLEIVKTYIADGSPKEVNISSQHKKCILKFQSTEDLSSLHPIKMATIFDDSLAEIERLIASNLLVTKVQGK